jgi:hypothetical protein
LPRVCRSGSFGDKFLDFEQIFEKILEAIQVYRWKNFLINLPKDKDLARIRPERQTLRHAFKKQLVKIVLYEMIRN